MNSNYKVTGNPFADMHNYTMTRMLGTKEEKQYWEEKKEYRERLERGLENEYK